MKKSRIEIAREIISSLKREMREPRLTQSVRASIGIKAAPVVEEPAKHSA